MPDLGVDAYSAFADGERLLSKAGIVIDTKETQLWSVCWTREEEERLKQQGHSLSATGKAKSVAKAKRNARAVV